MSKPVAAGGKFSRWGTASKYFRIHPDTIYPSITKRQGLRHETFKISKIVLTNSRLRMITRKKNVYILIIIIKN